MSDAFCECPSCRRRIIVRWNWDTLKTAYLHDEDGEAVTDSNCLDANRVVYQRHVTIDTPAGAYGYHYEDKYWDLFDCEELPKAKPWDGYDESDVGRLMYDATRLSHALAD